MFSADVLAVLDYHYSEKSKQEFSNNFCVLILNLIRKAFVQGSPTYMRIVRDTIIVLKIK